MTRFHCKRSPLYPEVNLLLINIGDKNTLPYKRNFVASISL